MKKILFGTMLLAWVMVAPIPTMAGISINIGIPLPPPIVFRAPPQVIVIPDADDVYAVPDIDVDVFFWNGWWWRPWEGRWYRSRYYNRGWAYYDGIPTFYFDVDPGWRGFYRNHSWHEHRWNFRRIPTSRLQKNWKSWHDNRYWRGKRTWGVQNYRVPPQQQKLEWRHQREQEYHRRPEVQKHQQWREEQQRRGEHKGREGGKEERGKGRRND
jgi:hypothetical protein